MGDSHNPDTSSSTANQPKKARALAHDLSNALEIIMQTSFLLGTLDLGENGKQWHQMLDNAVTRATAINQQLREAIRAETAD